MRIRSLVVVLMLLAVSARARASEQSAAAFAQDLMRQIPVTPEACGKPFEGAGAGTVFLCARSTADFEAFGQSWDQAVSRAEATSSVASSTDNWLTQVGGRIRWYTVGDKWVVVTFDKTRRVVMSYSKDRESVLSLTRDVTPPKRIPTDYTLDMRQDERTGLKQDVTGVVVLSAVVRRDGTVGEVEILGCLPRLRGLEQAAAATLKKWRYEPATKDGVPVSVSLLSTFTYGPGGKFRASDGSDYKDPNRYAPSPQAPRGAP